jgi:hypothetical protein
MQTISRETHGDFMSGITDGFFTEVVGGDLQEHQSVIVGIESPDTKQSPTTGAPGLRL